MGKMRGTTSGANDALADFPKLLQEGGTASRLQCGLRSSPSARSAADRNSYASGATWRSPSSFCDCQGRRNSPGPESRSRVSLKLERSHYELPITLSTTMGRVRTEDTSKMTLGLVQSKMPRDFLFLFQPCDADLYCVHFYPLLFTIKRGGGLGITVVIKAFVPKYQL